jgi:hypothetical protein
MKKITFILVLLGLMTTFAFAHLCNDVFIQAKDNLAVKVDIRDDQLRINSEASFRVFLLNTMDRDIVDIRLDVLSDDFLSSVNPSPEWKKYPRLKTKVKGGKKQYFEVKLRRKPGTQQGKYKIGLRLFNGKNKSMIFKTLDIGEAMEELKVPKSSAEIKIDGSASKAEWQNSLLCTSLYEYKKTGRYHHNCKSDVQTRFRFSHDQKNLYCLVDFQAKGLKDVAKIFIAPDSETAPCVISVNLHTGIASIEGKGDVKIMSGVNENRMEIAIPLSGLNMSGKKDMLVNVQRDRDDNIRTYWRGNKISVKDPLVYANFVLQK